MFKIFYLLVIVMTLVACNNSSVVADEGNETADSSSIAVKTVQHDPPECAIPQELIVNDTITKRLKGHLRSVFVNGKKTELFKVKVGYLKELIKDADCNSELLITLAAYTEDDIERYKLKYPEAEKKDIKNKPTLLFAVKGSTINLHSRAADIAVICPPPGPCDFPLVPEKDSTKKIKNQ